MPPDLTVTNISPPKESKTPLPETLVLSHCNGWTDYLGIDDDASSAMFADFFDAMNT